MGKVLSKQKHDELSNPAVTHIAGGNVSNTNTGGFKCRDTEGKILNQSCLIEKRVSNRKSKQEDRDTNPQRQN